VKVLAAGAEEHRERFAWEARLLEQLRHPSIVGHVAHGITAEGELYLAMEWLEGDAGALDRALARIDAGAADAASGPDAAAPPPALTEREQRRLYVIVAAAPPSAATLATGATQSLHDTDALRRRLKRDAGRFGADLELLADGSAIATLTGTGTATDHAAAAARCALALREALPAVPIALATGSGLLAGGLPVGEVVDRAAALLRDAATQLHRAHVRLRALLRRQLGIEEA